jgi:hypothetical protein
VLLLFWSSFNSVQLEFVAFKYLVLTMSLNCTVYIASYEKINEQCVLGRTKEKGRGLLEGIIPAFTFRS